MSVKLKSYFVGSVAFVIFAMLRNALPLHNMLFFVVACVIYTGVTGIAYCWMDRIHNTNGENPYVERLWSTIVVTLLGAWIILFYINETKAEHPLEASQLIRRYFPFPIWITLMLIGVGVSLVLLHKDCKQETQKMRRKIRTVISLLFTFGTSIQFYAPNIFQDIQGGTYHSHAYTNSIINVCWLIPYSEHMETLYGHYAIVFMPVLKAMHSILGIDYLTGIFIVCAVLAGISILLFLYILDYFAKHDVIFYLGMFAIGEFYFMLMQGGVYLQVHPHRMIFPILMCALALREYKIKKRYSVQAVVLLTVSAVWSMEVAIVTMLAFSIFRWAQKVCDGEAFSVKKLVSYVQELAIYCLIPFAFAYMTVNAYNLLVGGGLIEISEFMYPFISDRHYISLIELPLPDFTHAWVGSTFLFMGVVSVVLFQIFFHKKVVPGLKPYYLLIGSMSLGLTLYYINRPAEGCLFINIFFIIILEAIIFKKCQDVYKEWKKNKDSVFAKQDRFVYLSLRVVAVMILFVMAFDGIYSMPGAWKKSAETIWKREELMEFAQYVYVQIPPDAVSFGEGVPELMSLIDRDTHLHTTEWSLNNTPLETMEMVRYKLEDEQWFFCAMQSLSYLQDNYPGLTDRFYVHEIMEYNGVEFGFFRKIE